MKIAWNIIWRLALTVVLVAYVCVALLNYSVVQSVIGSYAGRHLSDEWGGKVKIGSLHIHPFNHLVANDLLLVAPNSDTILDAETLRVHFKRFPYSNARLEMKSVYLKNAYYHLAIYRTDDPSAPEFVRNTPRPDKRIGLNLQYILDHYYKGPRKKRVQKFTVDIDEVVLNHVHYKMDMPDRRKKKYDYGVEIPHMEFYDIKAKVTNLHVVNDDVTCRLVRFSTEERSGFKADNIAGRIHVGRNDITVRRFRAETARSTVKADVEILYDGWHGMKGYLNNVRHNIEIGEGSSIALADVAYWAPALWGVDIQLMPSGRTTGTVDVMHTDNMSLRFGHASEVAIDGDIVGLTDPENMTLALDNATLRFEQSDLSQITAMMPQYITPKLANFLREIEYLDMTAQAHGGWQCESTANITMVCGLGNLRADVTMTPCNGKRRVILNADSDGMGLTPLGSDWLTHSGFSLNVDADIPDETKELRDIDAEAFAYLTGSVVKGNNLNPINLHAKIKDGNMDFEASCDDTLLDIDMHGTANIADSECTYNVSIDLDRLQADTFGLVKSEYGRISTHLEGDLTGVTLDDMHGTITAKNTHIGPATLREARLTATKEDAGNKNLRFESDMMTATVSGHFDYADIPLMVQHIGYSVLPEDLQIIAEPDSVAMSAIESNTLKFHLRLDDGAILNQFMPKISLANGTRIDGSYNGNDLLRLVARTDGARWGSVAMDGIGLSSHYSEGVYLIDIESTNIKVRETDLINDMTMHLAGSRESASLQIAWGDSLQVTDGDLLIGLEQGDIQVLRPFFRYGDDAWRFNIDSLHLSTMPSSTLAGAGISLSSDRQRISSSLRLKRQANDFVEFEFDNFNIKPLSEMILMNSPFGLDGVIDGRFSLYGLSTTPYFNANMTLDSCILNRQELGTLAVRSTWNAEMNTLNLIVEGNTLRASGWIGLGEEDPDLDFSIGFNQFELASIAPLLATFSSRFDGQLEGELDIDGTLGKPNVVGEAYINSGALKVNQTGVTYYFNDSLRFTNKRITLDKFKLLDPLGNVATVDGAIGYNGLDNISIDLSLITDNILVLDQHTGDQFYGTMLVQADGHVSGSAETINISVHAKTNPGSTLTVPVSDRRQVQSQDFITFVGSNDIQTNEQQQSGNSAIGLNLEMDISITPDVQLNLPMDFSEVTVGVKGSGSGDLHMTLENRMTPQVMGNYEITSGTLKLGFISILEKTFSLEPGSNLNFQGSLPDARFDLQAVYSQRVNLSTLTGSLSAIDNTQKNIQVEDIIAINGTLNEPAISFDIRLPNADASIEEEVFTYIDRNSERDMLNQTVSLLLLGQFYNANGTMNDNNDILGNSLSSGYSMVASKMGSMVSDMVNIVDVDFKYKAATELTNEQVDVNISKDWGRWYLESTLGYGGDSRELESNANGNAVIDALLGYRISPLIHLYAYNRTNNNDYTRIDLPYKQGAGLKLTKDFDSWSELIKRKKSKQQ